VVSSAELIPLAFYRRRSRRSSAYRRGVL